MTNLIDFHEQYFGQVEGDRHYTLQELLQFAQKYSQQARALKLSTAVAVKFQISEVDMFSKSRKREYVNARQMYAALLKDCTNATLDMIGAEIGIDHATVIHSCSTVLGFYETERTFRQMYIEMKMMIDTNKVIMPWYDLKKIIDPNAPPVFTEARKPAVEEERYIMQLT